MLAPCVSHLLLCGEDITGRKERRNQGFPLSFRRERCRHQSRPARTDVVIAVADVDERMRLIVR
jgi:hypothetical protein